MASGDNPSERKDAMEDTHNQSLLRASLAGGIWSEIKVLNGNVQADVVAEEHGLSLVPDAMWFFKVD